MSETRETYTCQCSVLRTDLVKDCMTVSGKIKLGKVTLSNRGRQVQGGWLANGRDDNN